MFRSLPFSPSQRATLLGVLVVSSTATLLALSKSEAADPPRTITTDGIRFDAPADWTSTPPSNPQMRRAQLRINATKGDAKPAELVLFAFPGGVGSLDMNIERWANQFKDDDGNSPKPKIEKRKGKNTEVVFVETAGRYVSTIPVPVDEPNSRLLGAIVETPDAAFYFKLTGPTKTVEAARAGFEQLIKSIQIDP